MTATGTEYAEPWIEGYLRERLEQYRRRYPLFDVDRVMAEVATWEPKRQRWAPYMKDKDIKAINKSHHKSVSLRRLASLDSW